MAENIPAYAETLEAIYALAEDAPPPTFVPAGRLDVFHMNSFKIFCTSSAAEYPVFSTQASLHRRPGRC